MSVSKIGREIFKGLDRIVLLVIGLLFMVYLASGVHVVEADEMGVIFRFGAKHQTVLPGIGYHLPWPVERVRTVNVKAVRSVEVGFWKAQGRDQRLTPYCITGDVNIIHNLYVIHYRVDAEDPASYFLSARRIREMLTSNAEAAIIEVIGSRPVDEIITTAKTDMENAIRRVLQEKLYSLNVKLQIDSVDTREIKPPNQVRDAFDDVINAEQEMTTQKHKANTDAVRTIHEAEARADSIIQEARAYRTDRVNSARGEAERFLSLYDEYKEAPDIIGHRILLESVEKILPRTRVMLRGSDKQGRPLRLKIFQAPLPTSPRLPAASQE
ncbi:MAG: FtsH protease activity modulator HflK [bacterium]